MVRHGLTLDGCLMHPHVHTKLKNATASKLGARCSSVVRAFAHGAVGRRFNPSWCGPIELFIIPASAPQLVCLHRCMHLKEPLVIIGKSSPCGGSGFPLSLYEWFFTICLMPYNRK